MLDLISYYSRIFYDSWLGPAKASDDDVDANILVKKILHIHDQMVVHKGSDSFTEINDLFGGIRAICTKPVNERVSSLVLRNPRIIDIVEDLRDFCNILESQVESQWSMRATASQSSTEQEVCARVLEYPFINVYANLIRTELSGMRSVEKKPIEKIAFIGSGPLPLTSLCLTGMIFDAPTNISVMNIDRNAEALALSRTLCSRLGNKAGDMKFHCADAGTDLDLSEYDAVYLAALVGSSEKEKEALLQQVASTMRPGALMVIRCGDRLRSLIYSTLDPNSEAITKVLDMAAIIHPQKHNIANSIFIGRVKEDRKIVIPK